MIKKIEFSNYKLFKRQQTLELKPMTVLIGKNSSGKSAVLKLLTLIENSLSGNFQEPFLLTNNGIEIGGEFKDLIYGRRYGGQLSINLENDTEKLRIVIGYDIRSNNYEILSWILNDVEIDVSTEKFTGFLSESEKIKTLSLKTDYISSYREGLKRYFENNRKTYEVIGTKGENVYLILIEDSLTSSQNIIKKVSTFYQDNFDGWKISVNENNTPPYQIELEKGELRINLKEVGLGMIHALPLVVSASIPAKEEKLIIIEEPELHLHPAAHGNLAQLFAESLTDTNKHYLIETHSQNFVLRLRALVAEDKLDKEDLALYYVEYDEDVSESNLRLIDVDELGEVDYWPEDIFNESLHETIKIRKAQKEKLK
jgi:predicted ATPase